MTTKLTLSIDKKAVQKAKAYAAARNRSLSDLVEQYLLSLTTNRDKEPIKISRKVESLRGSIKSSEDIHYKKVLEDQIRKKHG